MTGIDINHYETATTDPRGRISIGVDRAGEDVTFVVFDPDSMTRLDGPDTKTVQRDGRLSLGTEYANKEITIGIV